MKVPKNVKGRHKLRDAKIVRAYAKDESITMEAVGQKYGLTGSRVQQIIYKNRHLLKLDKDYENYLQVRRAKNQIGRKPESKKDTLEWEQFLDKKLNGDKPLIDQSQHTHIVYVRKNARSSDPIRASELSATDTRFTESV